MIAAKKKFDEHDRQKVIVAIEQHFGISLKKIGSYRKYLSDQHGRRYIVLGGYEDWHGISRNIFDEEEATLGDTTLIIGKRSKTHIEIYSGSFQPLLDSKAHLAKTEDQYVFNLQSSTSGITVREVPNLRLRRLGEAKYSLEENQTERKEHEITALIERLSPKKRQELFQSLKERW